MPAINELIQPEEIINSGLMKDAPVNGMVTVDRIRPHINAAMAHVRVILGDTTYDDMVLKKNGAISNYNVSPIVKGFSGTSPIELQYEIIWSRYLRQYCAMMVYREALPFLTSSTGGQGEYSYGGDGGVTELLRMKIQSLQRSLDVLDTQIRKYLKDNNVGTLSEPKHTGRKYNAMGLFVMTDKPSPTRYDKEDHCCYE